jgi:hypothetical protein
MDSAEAFAAIALAAVACDGGLDHEEARSLRGQLEGRHPFSARSEESMGRLFDGLLDQLRSDGWRTLIGRAIPVLSPSQRVVADEEGDLLREMASLMALPAGRAEQILDVIAVLNRDSLAS